MVLLDLFSGINAGVFFDCAREISGKQGLLPVSNCPPKLFHNRIITGPSIFLDLNQEYVPRTTALENRHLNGWDSILMKGVLSSKESFLEVGKLLIFRFLLLDGLCSVTSK